MNVSRAGSVPPPFQKPGDFLPAAFFALFFYLCSADLFFAVRVHDLNLRYGQLILSIYVLVSLVDLAREFRNRSSQWRQFQKLVVAWGPFFLFYALSSLFADLPGRSLLKTGWALFNIGGTALLFWNNRWGKSLKKGMGWGIMALALTICIQFVILYTLGISSFYDESHPGSASEVRWGGLFLGYAQFAGRYEGLWIFRPHAFYYEPSYAACALTLSFPLCLYVFSRKEKKPLFSILTLALVLVAVWMTSSRSGLLGTSLEMAVVLLVCALSKQRHLFLLTVKTLLAALLMVGLLALPSQSRKYLGFAAGLSNLDAVTYRLKDSHSSEGWRMANVIHSLELWREHPFLGRGVPPLSADRGVHGLGQTSESMWLEVAVESGLLGFLAFAFGILKTLWDALWKNENTELKTLILSAMAAHLLISMNLTSTFPRLDYWVLFFFAARLCLKDRPEGEVPRAVSPLIRI